MKRIIRCSSNMGRFETSDVVDYIDSTIVGEVDPVVRIYSDGFYDLEKSGYNGIGFYVGYEHGRTGRSSSAKLRMVKNALPTIEQIFKNYLIDLGITNLDIVIEDKTNIYDSYRIYCITN